jgi:hypothetical protein
MTIPLKLYANQNRCVKELYTIELQPPTLKNIFASCV